MLFLQFVRSQDWKLTNENLFTYVYLLTFYKFVVFFFFFLIHHKSYTPQTLDKISDENCRRSCYSVGQSKHKSSDKRDSTGVLFREITPESCSKIFATSFPTTLACLQAQLEVDRPAGSKFKLRQARVVRSVLYFSQKRSISPRFKRGVKVSEAPPSPKTDTNDEGKEKKKKRKKEKRKNSQTASHPEPKTQTLCLSTCPSRNKNLHTPTAPRGRAG